MKNMQQIHNKTNQWSLNIRQPCNEVEKLTRLESVAGMLDWGEPPTIVDLILASKMTHQKCAVMQNTTALL